MEWILSGPTRPPAGILNRGSHPPASPLVHPLVLVQAELVFANVLEADFISLVFALVISTTHK